MTEQNEPAQGPWTEEEAAAYAQALTAFRDSLPPRQRDAFNAMAAVALPSSAYGGTGTDDVEGYVAGRDGGIGRIPMLGRVVFGTPGVTDYVEGVYHNPYAAEHGPG